MCVMSLSAQEEQQRLTERILSFKVPELQLLLGFAARNKYGSKQELQNRAVSLLKLGSKPIQTKINEIYKAACDQAGSKMMGPGGNMNNYTAAAYQQMLSLAGYTAQQAALSNTRNPYTQPAAFPGRYISLHATCAFPGRYIFIHATCSLPR